MNKKMIIAPIILLSAAAAAFAVSFLTEENNALTTTYLDVEVNNIQGTIRIVLLSDLHGKKFGRDNDILIKKIENINPDLICFAGDLTNGRDKKGKTDKTGLKLLADLNKSYPVLYIPGNHEYNGGEKIKNLHNELQKSGVRLLKSQIQSLTIKDNNINILGLEELENPNSVESLLTKFEKKESPKIVLSHFPENFPKYAQYNIDLILSGHAHGGQIILPLLGGLYAPGQGLFPKYYKGLYETRSVKMAVSRGLGSSVFPQRLFNRPEIVIVDIRPNDKS